jgi:hypothetical protein
LEVQVQGPGGINENGVKILPVFSQLPRARNKNTCTRCKSYWGVTDFTRTVNSSKAFRGIPSEKRWRSYCKVSDGSPGAAIKVPNFYPRIAAAALGQRKTPASSDTGVSPTSITCSYYSSSGRSIRLSVKYAPVGSSCEPLRTLSAEPSSVKVSRKSPFSVRASSIESNSTTA